ncbi:MAG: Carotenogenesis protein CarS [Myxococcaceae bacterium]|nr:Carotenogenesis protein CarS [Myxococcaceae bacterium]
MGLGAKHVGELLELDVAGAPLRLGQRVKIRRGDSTADPRFAGKQGEVRGLLYEAPERYPKEPFIAVHVEGLGQDLFFPAELAALK